MMLLDAISEWVEPVSIGPYRARRLFLITLNVASMVLARMMVDAPSGISSTVLSGTSTLLRPWFSLGK